MEIERQAVSIRLLIGIAQELLPGSGIVYQVASFNPSSNRNSSGAAVGAGPACTRPEVSIRLLIGIAQELGLGGVFDAQHSLFQSVF